MYLFFDIECCDGQNICEFGYVKVDSDLTVIEKDVLTINPEKSFNLGGRKEEISLAFTKQQYYSSPTYPHFYDKIKNLLTNDNQIILGYALSNDADFIKNACERYHLPIIAFNYYDVQKIFKDEHPEVEKTSLEIANEYLKNPEIINHRSDEDSLATFYVVKKLAENKNISIDDLVKSNEKYFGSIDKNGNITDSNIVTLDDRLQRSSETNRLNANNKKLLKYFEQNIKVNRQAKTILSDKKVSICTKYQIEHFRETMSLIKLITNAGGIYIHRYSESDYIMYEEKYYENYKGDTVAEKLKIEPSELQKINIISLKDLLILLNVNENQLKSMPFPEKSAFEMPKKSNNHNKNKHYKNKDNPKSNHEKLTTNIGDLLSKQLKDVKF